jgi:hypothetical protein
LPSLVDGVHIVFASALAMLGFKSIVTLPRHLLPGPVDDIG